MKQWSIAQLNKANAGAISEKYELPAIIAALLDIRGIYHERGSRIESVDLERNTVLLFGRDVSICGSADHIPLNEILILRTLAKSELQVFLSENDMAQKPKEKPDLFWEWILYLQKVFPLDIRDEKPKESVLYTQALKALQDENVQVEPYFCQCGISH